MYTISISCFYIRFKEIKTVWQCVELPNFMSCVIFAIYTSYFFKMVNIDVFFWDINSHIQCWVKLTIIIVIKRDKNKTLVRTYMSRGIEWHSHSMDNIRKFALLLLNIYTIDNFYFAIFYCRVDTIMYSCIRHNIRESLFIA